MGLVAHPGPGSGPGVYVTTREQPGHGVPSKPEQHQAPISYNQGPGEYVTVQLCK